MIKRIFFTGGGSAGHVIPNLPLMDFFNREGWEVEYIGSNKGIEKEMIKATGTTFHAVKNGKLRRYFSFKNLIDPFKIMMGIIQCWIILKRRKPEVVFSKGGFVAFPVVVGAWLNRIPVVAHESDISPGLANKLCIPFIHTLCVTSEATLLHLKRNRKVIVTGTPVREELFKGDKLKGLALCQFVSDKPCLLVMGGGAGAQSINIGIRAALPELLQEFQIIHLCGKGKRDQKLEGIPGYKQFEYVNEELPDLFACADMVISRSGANSLYEILALRKPHILIPLSARVSRGDQIHNANFFEKKGISIVIADEAVNANVLLQAIARMKVEKETIIQRIKEFDTGSATEKIVQIVRDVVNDSSTKKSHNSAA